MTSFDELDLPSAMTGTGMIPSHLSGKISASQGNSARSCSRKGGALSGIFLMLKLLSQTNGEIFSPTRIVYTFPVRARQARSGE